jgi:hypothetical protein
MPYIFLKFSLKFMELFELKFDSPLQHAARSQERGVKSEESNLSAALWSGESNLAAAYCSGESNLAAMMGQ